MNTMTSINAIALIDRYVAGLVKGRLPMVEAAMDQISAFLNESESYREACTRMSILIDAMAMRCASCLIDPVLIPGSYLTLPPIAECTCPAAELVALRMTVAHSNHQPDIAIQLLLTFADSVAATALFGELQQVFFHLTNIRIEAEKQPSLQVVFVDDPTV